MRIIERSKVAARAGGPEQIRRLPWEKRMRVSFRIAKELGRKKAMEKIGLQLLDSYLCRRRAVEIEKAADIARDLGMAEKAQELAATRLRIAFIKGGHRSAQRLIKRFKMGDKSVRRIASDAFSELVKEGRYTEAAELSEYGLKNTEEIALKAAAQELLVNLYWEQPFTKLKPAKIKEAAILAAANEMADLVSGHRLQHISDRFKLAESDLRKAALLSLGMLKDEGYPWYSLSVSSLIRTYCISNDELIRQAKKDLKKMVNALEAITEMDDSEHEFLCRVLRFRQEASDLAIVLKVKNSIKPDSS